MLLENLGIEVGFKSDREFLRNVSIGAIGTRQVAAVLNRGGFRIIELERYCTSNKIWATKIKRLRVPDLLCLNSGTRIESRGKSKLEITMSHSVNNPERAWDKGLRDSDLVAFVRCWPDGDGWRASERVVLFRVGDMRKTSAVAGLSRMKSAAEGSEIRLTWPATVPAIAGKVTAVSREQIETQLANGRRQKYRLIRKDEVSLNPYLAVGDTFGDGDSVIASVISTTIPPVAADAPQYDFFSDLDSDDKETVYVAVKAIGFLPDSSKHAAKRLANAMIAHPDGRIRLEAAASLARLGNQQGWDHLADNVRQSNVAPEYRMESALILAELPFERSIDLLAQLAERQSNDSELRAAGAWGLSNSPAGLDKLLALTDDEDELTAVHAIVGASRLIDVDNVGAVLRQVGHNDRRAAGLIKAVLLSGCECVPKVVGQIQSRTGPKQRQWLLYLLAATGREACGNYVKIHAPELLPELEFFWTHHVENWTNRLDVADQLDFLKMQMVG
jgi:hypothetical protein